MSVAHKIARQSLRFLHKKLLFSHKVALRRPKLTLAVFFTFVTLAWAPLGQLRMLLSIDDLVDADFKTYTQLKELNHQFLNQDEILIVLRHVSPRDWSKQELCLVSRWIQNTADTRGDIRAIVSTLGLQWPTETSVKFHFLPILQVDCTNSQPETDKIRAGFDQLKKSPWRGTLTSLGADDVAILIYPDARLKADFFGTFNREIVDGLQKSFTATVGVGAPEIKASWIGDGIFQYHLRRGYELMPLLNLVMSFLALLFFRAAFGTWLSGALFLTTVTWASLPVYAGMALLHHPIDVLSSSLSLMIYIASIEDFVILSYLRRTMGWRRAFRRMLLPSFFTSLSTVIGFGSLAFGDLGIIRRFGLWAAAGSAMEWIVVFIALPAIFTLWPKFSTWTKETKILTLPLPLQSWLQWRPQGRLRYLLLLVFPIALWGARSLTVSDSPERLLPESHVARQALKTIEDSRGWRGQASLVFQDHEHATFNQSVLEKAKIWPMVAQVEDVYSINKYLSRDLSPQMRGMLENILEHNTLGHRLGPNGLTSRAVLYLKNLDIVDINRLRQNVAMICPNGECWLAGTLVSYGELGERILSTLYQSLGVSLLLVLLVLLWLCLAIKPESFPAIAISSTWGAAALLCAFYLMHIPLTYTISMIASILVGVSGDNAVLFLFFSGRDGDLNRAVQRMGAASLLVTVGMILAASVFFLGYFAPMRTLGLMLIVGFALVVLGDVWVLRAFTSRNRR